jgi:hypothetical protein
MRPIERSGSRSIEPLADPAQREVFRLGIVSEDWKPGCNAPFFAQILVTLETHCCPSGS